MTASAGPPPAWSGPVSIPPELASFPALAPPVPISGSSVPTSLHPDKGTPTQATRPRESPNATIWYRFMLFTQAIAGHLRHAVGDRVGLTGPESRRVPV